jgi:hypothetical protein
MKKIHDFVIAVWGIFQEDYERNWSLQRTDGYLTRRPLLKLEDGYGGGPDSIEQNVAPVPLVNEEFKVGFVGDLPNEVIKGIDDNVDMLEPEEYPGVDTQGNEMKVKTKGKGKRNGKKQGTRPVEDDATEEHEEGDDPTALADEQESSDDGTEGEGHAESNGDDMGSGGEEGYRHTEGNASSGEELGVHGRKRTKGLLKGKGKAVDHGEDNLAKGNAKNGPGKETRHPHSGGHNNAPCPQDEDTQGRSSNASGGTVTSSSTTASTGVDDKPHSIISRSSLTPPPPISEMNTNMDIFSRSLAGTTIHGPDVYPETPSNPQFLAEKPLNGMGLY